MWDLTSMSKKSKMQNEVLHDLLSSRDPKKHELALLMMGDGADFKYTNAECDELLLLAVETKAFSVIEVILKNVNRSYCLRDDVIALILRSPNAEKVLKLCFQYEKLGFFFVSEYIPWDMSEDHIKSVVQTLVQLAAQKEKLCIPYIFQSAQQHSHKLARYLLNYRNDANEKLINFNIMLSTSDEERELTAFLIREGEDINDCFNGEYPLHLACGDERLKTVRLFLKLGADVNVTNRFGRTPFSMVVKNFSDNMLHCITELMIKHFAILNSTGNEINNDDMSIIRRNPCMQKLYDSYFEELEKMKTIQAADAFPYHSFFSRTSYELSLLMRDAEFLKQLKKGLLRVGFPLFYDDMVAKFGIAKRMINHLVSREQELEEVFRSFCVQVVSMSLPCLVIHKIARYSLDFKNIEKEYHLKNYLL